MARLAARVAPIAAFRYHGNAFCGNARCSRIRCSRAGAEAMLIDYRALFR